MCVRALFQRRFLCGEVCGEKRKWGEGVRNSGRRNSVTVFFFRNRFRHACRSLPGGGEGGGGGRRDIWRVLMFVSIFEIRRFIRVRWIVVRSVINIVGVGV